MLFISYLVFMDVLQPLRGSALDPTEGLRTPNPNTLKQAHLDLIEVLQRKITAGLKAARIQGAMTAYTNSSGAKVRIIE